jgi:hypothetical protein
MSENISKWITEGSEINDFNQFNGFIYQNNVVRKFLHEPKRYFIIAGKGIGKTVLLKYKRYLAELDFSGVLFLPKDKPFIDFVDELNKTLSENEIRQFSDKNFCKSFWLISLELCLLAAVTVSEDELSKFLKDLDRIATSTTNLKGHFEFLLAPKRGIVSIVNYIIRYIGESEMQKLFDASFLLTDLFRNCINRPVFYYFDRLDQSFKDSDANIWISMQQGLLESAWELMKSNPHVKIYMSIRQEAFDSFTSFNKESMMANISLLEYTDKELRELMLQLIHFYEKKNSFKEFLGIEFFKNTVVHNDEDVYRFMNRYSIGRPRDFVVFGGALSDKIRSEFNSEEERTKKLKETVINTASNSIITGLHSEVKMLLKCLKTQEEFDSFLKLINHNVLTYEELQHICKKYNRNSDDKCLNCIDKSICSHPFCDLYIMGLLGKVQRPDGENAFYKQIFKSPYVDVTKAVTYNDSEFFLIHPALRSYIQSLQKSENEHYEIYDCLLIGDDLPWPKEYTEILYIHKEIDSTNDPKTIKFLTKILIDYVKGDQKYTYSELTEEFQKLNTQLTTEISSTVSKILSVLSRKKDEKISIFISYAYDSENHKRRVISFTNMLRRMGFNAVMDENLLRESKNDLQIMMDTGLSMDKVIVVLSEQYKRKADGHYGGVWKEYGRILADLQENSKKYIFVSFDAFSNDLRSKIQPESIQNLWIVDLERDRRDKFSELVSYITGLERYPWAPVSDKTYFFDQKEIPEFGSGD